MALTREGAESSRGRVLSRRRLSASARPRRGALPGVILVALLASAVPCAAAPAVEPAARPSVSPSLPPALPQPATPTQPPTPTTTSAPTASPGSRRYVRLLHERTPEASRCPDEHALKAAVAERLGYDPFVSEAARTLRASFSADAGALVARVQIVEPSGQTSGIREIRSRERSCAEIGAAAALAISIAVDPEQDLLDPAGSAPTAQGRDTAGTPSPVMDNESQPQTPATSAAAEAGPNRQSLQSPPRAHVDTDEPAPSDLRWEPFATAGALGAAGLSSSRPLTAALLVGGGARWAHLSVAVEAAVSLPESAAHPANMAGRVHAFTVGLALVACGSRTRVALCAVGAFDLTHAWARRYAWTSSTTLSSLGGGVRAAVDWPIGHRLSALAFLETVVYGRRAVVEVDTEPAILTPRVRLTAGLGLRFNFL